MLAFLLLLPALQSRGDEVPLDSTLGSCMRLSSSMTACARAMGCGVCKFRHTNSIAAQAEAQAFASANLNAAAQAQAQSDQRNLLNMRQNNWLCLNGGQNAQSGVGNESNAPNVTLPAQYYGGASCGNWDPASAMAIISGVTGSASLNSKLNGGRVSYVSQKQSFDVQNPWVWKNAGGFSEKDGISTAVVESASFDRLKATVQSFLTHLKSTMFANEEERIKRKNKDPIAYHDEVGSVLKEACKHAAASHSGSLPLCKELSNRFEKLTEDVFENEKFAEDVASGYFNAWNHYVQQSRHHRRAQNGGQTLQSAVSAFLEHATQRMHEKINKDASLDDKRTEAGRALFETCAVGSHENTYPPKMCNKILDAYTKLASEPKTGTVLEDEASLELLKRSIMDASSEYWSYSAGTFKPSFTNPIDQVSAEDPNNHEKTSDEISDDLNQAISPDHHHKAQVLDTCEDKMADKSCCINSTTGHIHGVPDVCVARRVAAILAKNHTLSRVRTLEKTKCVNNSNCARIYTTEERNLANTVHQLLNLSMIDKERFNSSLSLLMQALNETESKMSIRVMLSEKKLEKHSEANDKALYDRVHALVEYKTREQLILMNKELDALKFEMTRVNADAASATKRLQNATSDAHLASRYLAQILKRTGEHTSEIKSRLDRTEELLSDSRHRVLANLTAHFNKMTEALDEHIHSRVNDAEKEMAKAMQEERNWMENERHKTMERAAVYKQVFNAMSELNRSATARTQRHNQLMQIAEMRYNDIIARGQSMEEKQESALRMLEFNRTKKEQEWWSNQAKLQAKHESILRSIEQSEWERVRRHAEMESKLENALNETKREFDAQLKIERENEKKHMIAEREARETMFNKVLEKGLHSLAEKNAHLEQLNQKVILKERQKLIDQRKEENEMVKKELSDIRTIEKGILSSIVKCFQNKSSALLLRHKQALQAADTASVALERMLETWKNRSIIMQQDNLVAVAKRENSFARERISRKNAFQKETQELLVEARKNLAQEEKEKAEEQAQKTQKLLQLDALRSHQQQAIADANKLVQKHYKSEEEEKHQSRVAHWPNLRNDVDTEIKGYMLQLLHDNRYESAPFIQAFKKECFKRAGSKGEPPNEMCDAVISNFISHWADKDLGIEANRKGMANESAGLIIPYLDALHRKGSNSDGTNIIPEGAIPCPAGSNRKGCA
ncbi:hypothetical protein AAMO2058_001236100 [Amorphochlora amoebiformis]